MQGRESLRDQPVLTDIDSHPNWDQYRLVQAALAGFLVQNGAANRDLTRCYLANLFPGRTNSWR